MKFLEQLRHNVLFVKNNSNTISKVITLIIVTREPFYGLQSDDQVYIGQKMKKFEVAILSENLDDVIKSLQEISKEVKKTKVKLG